MAILYTTSFIMCGVFLLSCVVYFLSCVVYCMLFIMWGIQVKQHLTTLFQLQNLNQKIPAYKKSNTSSFQIPRLHRKLVSIKKIYIVASKHRQHTLQSIPKRTHTQTHKHAHTHTFHTTSQKKLFSYYSTALMVTNNVIGTAWTQTLKPHYGLQGLFCTTNRQSAVVEAYCK